MEKNSVETVAEGRRIVKMIEWIKSYHVFLPGRWGKWMIYIIVPAVFLGIEYLFYSISMYAQIGIILISALIISLEMYMDYFIFGGIASKDTNKLEYLKTSIRGMEILKKSLIGDAVRRFLSISLIVYGLKYTSEVTYSGVQAMTLVLCYFVLSELLLFITRHFSFLSLITAGAILVSAAVPPCKLT